MNAIWIVAGLSVAGAVIAIVTAWQRAGAPADMGAVSTQWISEHRLGQGNDLRR